MVGQYQAAPNRQTVAILANKYGKSEKSIIGKLSKEGVYKRAVYVTKLGEKPVTKAELVEDIEEYFGLMSGLITPQEFELLAMIRPSQSKCNYTY